MNFDENQWYHIYIGGDKGGALMGTHLVFGDPHLEDTTKQNSTTGAVFLATNKIEDDEPAQKWQIVSFDSDYYVLKSAAAGSRGYLASFFAEDRTNLSSRTLARMVRDNVSDTSVFWKIEAWRDGSFRLKNKANGTDLLLELGGEHDNDSGTEAHMSSNFTNISRRQFSFEAIGEVNGKDIGTIDNEQWSRAAISVSSATRGSWVTATLIYAQLPATTTQQTTQSQTTTSTPTTNTADPSNSATTNTTTSESSGGLSTGAKAGIGAGIGAAALIALVVLGLFLFRRRKRRAVSANEPNPYEQYSDNGEGAVATKYGHYGVANKPELDSTMQRAELQHTNARPAELSGGELPRSELAGGESQMD